jgi:hypothetical protein
MNDFSGGLNTYVGALSLPLNASPDMLNVLPLPGRLKYRGGSLRASALPYTTDQAYDFYDTTDAKHQAVFAGGNIYDTVGGTPALVLANAYTAGDRVGVCTVRGVLYWSTQTIAIQYWNPATSATGAVVKTGSSDVPCSPYLFVYAGSIVALGVNYVPATPADYQPTVMGWCVPNQVGNWAAASSQAVGPLIQGATLEFGIVLGIANTGVPPTRTIVVGRSDVGLIAYTGALGSLQENAINCPVGCRDGASAVFCPGADGFGDVIFLGSDGQFWKTNGINAIVASLDIQTTLQMQVQNAPAGGRFWAGYNQQQSYYFCNVGSFQFVYKWDIKKWALFTGWPNGVVLNTTDIHGVPALFIASSDPAILGYYQIAVPQIGDRDTVPSIYYRTPWLHAGDPELLKIWSWITLLAYNTGTRYVVTAVGLERPEDNTQMQSDPLYLGSASATGIKPFVLDSSLLDGPDVLTAAPSGSSGPLPIMMRGRLSAPVTWEPDSMCRGILEEIVGGGGAIREDMKAVAIQFTIAYNAGIADFDVLGIQTRFTSRGYKREGGDMYDSSMGVPNPRDPFVYNNLTPADVILPS